MVVDTYKDFTTLIFETNEIIKRLRFLRPAFAPRLSMERSEGRYTITLTYAPKETVLTCQIDSDIMFDKNEVAAFYEHVLELRTLIDDTIERRWGSEDERACSNI